MYQHYHKEYSYRIGRDMEFEVYGHAGRPLLVFPTQSGRFHDFKDRGMIYTLSPFIEAGKLRVFAVDGIDNEAVDAIPVNPHHAAWRMECYFRYITEEFVPRLHDYTQSDAQPIATGASLGATHAVNAYLRRPDLFYGVLGMAGLYDLRLFFGGCDSPYVYDNNPVEYLERMPYDHPWVSLYRQGKIVIAIGQGAWEGELLPSNRKLEQLLRAKDIPAWVDYWGFDVNHDWPWWHKMIVYYLGHLLST